MQDSRISTTQTDGHEELMMSPREVEISLTEIVEAEVVSFRGRRNICHEIAMR